MQNVIGLLPHELSHEWMILWNEGSVLGVWDKVEKHKTIEILIPKKCSTKLSYELSNLWS